MGKMCPKCETSNADTSRFCVVCGMTLGATVVQGRTVVMPSLISTPTVPPCQGDVAVSELRGSQVAAANSNRETQRELTVFVEDVSGSMGGAYDHRLNKLQAAQRAAASMVINKARLDDQDEIGLVSFNHCASMLLPICLIASRRTDIIKAIQSLEVSGGTDINEGLTAARDMFDWHRHDVVRRIVLLTDGHGGDPLHTADELKNRGVVIDVVGVGTTPTNVDERLLRAVASVIEGETRYRFIKDSQTLVEHYTQLANKTAVCG